MRYCRHEEHLISAVAGVQPFKPRSLGDHPWCLLPFPPVFPTIGHTVTLNSCPEAHIGNLSWFQKVWWRWNLETCMNVLIIVLKVERDIKDIWIDQTNVRVKISTCKVVATILWNIVVRKIALPEWWLVRNHSNPGLRLITHDHVFLNKTSQNAGNHFRTNCWVIHTELTF